MLAARSDPVASCYRDPPNRIEPETRLRAALKQAGQPYEGSFRYGEFIRYGDKGRSRPCWLIIQLLRNGHLTAVFGDWRQGSRHEFRSWSDATFSFPMEWRRELEEWRCRQEAAVAARQAQAARLAAELWGRLALTGNHPYLERKQVPAMGVRFGSDEQGRGPCLVIPLRKPGEALTSLQFIYPDGRKHFLRGGAKKGAFHVLGGIGPDSLFYLAEGYATAASLHLATGRPAVVAFDAGNLAAVAAALRCAYPAARLVLAADNDRWKAAEIGPDGRPKGNTGVMKAAAVARQYGAYLAVPDFTGLDTCDRPTDFNDLARLAGLEEVRRQLSRPVRPGRPFSP
jgi:putative DNA primase/helicase